MSTVQLAECQIQEVASKVKMTRWLLTKADSRGLTHGEKHYLIQTALFILADVQSIVGINGTDFRNEVESLDAGDIPF
jgi:hypothetical protein